MPSVIATDYIQIKNKNKLSFCQEIEARCQATNLSTFQCFLWQRLWKVNGRCG